MLAKEVNELKKNFSRKEQRARSVEPHAKIPCGPSSVRLYSRAARCSGKKGGKRTGMKLIDRYIGRQVLLSAFFAVLVLSIVLVMGSVFKYVLSQLVDRPDLDLGFILKILLNVLPFSLAITIPWGFLTAILLNFGRLSADNELVSLRMAGMSISRICFSVAILALMFTGICGYIKLRAEPAARANLEKMLPDMLYNLASKNPLALFTDKKVMEEIPRHLIYTHRNGDDLTDFQMVVLDDQQHPKAFVAARKVDVGLDPNSKELEMLLNLHDAYIEGTKSEDGFSEVQFMGARQFDWSVPLTELRETKVKMKPETLQVPEILDNLKRKDLSKVERSALRTEISLRFSFSMACITLGLIGIPLGITAQRRETSVGFALSLAIGIVYFLMMTIVELLREQYRLYPHLLAIVPNVVFLTLGTIQFRRLSRK